MRLTFDGFEIDPDAGQLIRGGVEVKLEPRALDLLCYLATHPGRLLRKQELVAQVWKARALSDNVLSNTVGKLRRALGQAARIQTPIETVHGRGYRWRALARPPAGATIGPATVQPLAASDHAYVGRGQVLELLTNAIETSLQGRGPLLLIAGEAGIGKTRTLERLSDQARARDFCVWSGTAHDGGGAPAYWPWIEILRSAHADLEREAWQRHLPANPRALSQLVPELVETKSAKHAHGQLARFELFDEIARFLMSVSAELPCLIVLDDLHWADLASVELLASIGRALARRPILIAAAVRDRDGVLNALQQAALRRLERIGTRVQLEGLSSSEVVQLIGALEGTRVVESHLGEALHRRTQGNPFFVRQILALLAQRSTPASAASVTSVELPAAVRSAIAQRIGTLPLATREILMTAAVIGQEFDAALLASVAALTLAQVLTAIDPARNVGVLMRCDSGTHAFAFGHSLLREVLYEELSLARRGALHTKLAHTLAAHPLHDDRWQLGELARHHLLAVPTDLDQCLRYGSLAAAAAREASGFEAAAELLSRTLHKLASEPGREADCCEIMLLLGFDQLCGGDFDGAWQTLRRGAALAVAIDNPALVGGFACRMVDWLDLGGDEHEARSRLEHALATLSGDNLAQRAALLARQAKLSSELPSAGRDALLTAAEELARQCGDPAVQFDIAFCRASMRDPAHPEASRAAANQLRALSQRYPEACISIRDRLRRESAHLTEYHAALTEGDLASADRALASCSAAARGFQVAALDMVIELARAGRALAEGRLDELEASLPHSIENANDYGVPAMSWYLYMVLVAEARGQLRSLGSMQLPEIKDPRNTRNSHHQLIRQLWAAWFYAGTGQTDAARVALSALCPLQLARMPVRFGDLALLCLLAETYRALDDREGARALLTQLTPYAARNAVGVLGESRGSVAYYLGLLADMLGERRAALEQLERAEQMNESMAMPLLLERTRALLSQLRARAESAR